MVRNLVGTFLEVGRGSTGRGLDSRNHRCAIGKRGRADRSGARTFSGLGEVSARISDVLGKRQSRFKPASRCYA